MKLTLDPLHPTHYADGFASSTLKTWYDANPSIRRLWAIQPDTQDASALRVIVMLEPSPDSDETSPAWMARGAEWEIELRQQLAGEVQLERIDGPLPYAFEVDGSGVLLSHMHWRDSTLLQD